ncbi:hypothetical protein, partial [Roseovarius sp.]|uniref:hypothetical protein n=1 Tax=Roseovarius sp. TaxID=1486281 RepID=UPI0026278589
FKSYSRNQNPQKTYQTLECRPRGGDRVSATQGSTVEVTGGVVFAMSANDHPWFEMPRVVHADLT